MNLKTPEYVPGHGLIKGKSVLVTAAAGAGIGFSAAKRAAEEGARAIVLSDIHEGRLEAAVEKLKEETGLQEVYGKIGNVAVEDDVQALVDFAEESMDGVDILFNNAGLGTSKLLIEMEDDEDVIEMMEGEEEWNALVAESAGEPIGNDADSSFGSALEDIAGGAPATDT